MGTPRPRPALFRKSLGQSYVYNTIKYDADMIYGAGLAKMNQRRSCPSARSNQCRCPPIRLTWAAAGPLDARFSIMNILDRVYEMRNGSGIGVAAPQYSVRRTRFPDTEQTILIVLTLLRCHRNVTQLWYRFSAAPLFVDRSLSSLHWTLWFMHWNAASG